MEVLIAVVGWYLTLCFLDKVNLLYNSVHEDGGTEVGAFYRVVVHGDWGSEDKKGWIF